MQNYTKSELNFFTNYWCRTKGIHSRDLESHPQADDVVLMLKYREDLWQLLNNSEQAVWGAYWNIVYHKRRKLTFKALDKLEKITINALDRQTIISQQRQRIKSLRQNPINKPTEDMTAKAVGSTHNASWL